MIFEARARSAHGARVPLKRVIAPGAWIILAPGSPDERAVPVRGRLLVGRVCEGADPDRRLVLNDPAVSRDHLEIIASEAAPRLVDRSTNGTHLNGRRLERGRPVVLHDGDRIELGSTKLVFRGQLEWELEQPTPSTLRAAAAAPVAIVVGDVVGYTLLAESHGSVAVAEATDALFAALAELLTGYGGTVRNHAGDAMLASWDLSRHPGAAEQTVRFALAADQLVLARAPALSIRSPGGAQLRHMISLRRREAAGVGGPSGRCDGTRRPVTTALRQQRLK